MITRELEALLAQLSGYQPGEIDQRTRPLRQFDKIPHGPRGLNAPELTPHSVAFVLLTMIARRAVDAGETAMRAAGLKCVPRKGSPSVYADLSGVLVAGITQGSEFLKRVEILGDGSLAWVTLVAEGKAIEFLFTDSADVTAAAKRSPDLYEKQGSFYCGHRLVITGALIDQIRLEMTENDDATGYSAKKRK